MYRETVTTDTRIERLVHKVQSKTEFVTVVLNRNGQIIDKKLWCQPDYRGYSFCCSAIHRLLNLLCAISLSCSSFPFFFSLYPRSPYGCSFSSQISSNKARSSR